MKSIFTVLFLIAAMAEVRAQSIQGTMVLKGSIKTKIMVNGIKTVCKMKIDKVKNLLEEDAYGNPAYQLQAEIELDGTEFGKSIQVKHKQQTVLNLSLIHISEPTRRTPIS